MEDTSVEPLPKQAEELFNRGFAAIERGNLDYAVEMLSNCVAAAPGFVRGWKFLRAAEVKRYRKKTSGTLTGYLETALRMPTYLGALALLKSGKFQAAMMQAERLLREDPVNPLYGKLFAQAAVGMELPEVAILTLETVRDSQPNDISVLSWLGVFYQKVGRMRSARECFERLCELSPNDPKALKQLKDAMALDSMASDGWEKTAERGGSFREVLKDSEQAALLEQGAKSTRSETGQDVLIEDMKRKIEAEPGNINFRRGLANLYAQKHDYDAAIAILETAIELNPGDPELERARTHVHLRRFEYEAERRRNAGDEAGVAEVETQRLQYKFDDLRDRVERYPNDLQLRFEWGIMLYENAYINEAIQQLQLAQRSARNRVQALYYLGVCFRAKQQYEVATRQLETALAELPILDANKKKVLYELGEIADLTGHSAKAVDYFMQIYEEDIAYRDVAERVENAGHASR